MTVPAAILLALAGAAAHAQTVPAAAASAPAQRLDRVEITGGRGSDIEQRRQSTAAKIVIGREEIDRHGDSTLGEVLKRLPGITLQGAPGRGGGIRMRGLGGGYTQILLDGQRVPPGFSLDSLTPEQVERIEILRAPTAETGTRAIAGTLNIVTREGFRKRLNDWKAGVRLENGTWSPGVSWNRNQAFGDWTVNASLSAFRQDNADHSTTATSERAAEGSTQFEQFEVLQSRLRRTGVHLGTRLQWRGDAGQSFTLSPFIVHSQADSRRQATLRQAVPDPSVTPPSFERAIVDGEDRFTLARLDAQWHHRVGGSRLEWRAGVSRASSANPRLRQEFDANAAAPKRLLDEAARIDDDSGRLSLKWLAPWGAEHSLVAGAELEGMRRTEARSTLETDASGTRRLLDTLGDSFAAGSTRVALYAQDEWNLTPRWAAHAGLRWEGITTRSDAEPHRQSTHRSSVWTPIAHAVWKPDPAGRDQLRLSLTRSYKSPTLSSLIARPALSTRYPLDGPAQSPDGATNRETAPDRVGNPALKPELATGIDIAAERYLAGGGILSVNLFHRRIRDLNRTLIALESPPWSPSPRWVARPLNLGRATTQGIELEAKFRASDVWANAPAVDLRANLGLFRSRVASVPGPDNRLDQQARATANLGADHRLRGWPLALGGNIHWNPDTTTRLSASQVAYQGVKRVVDTYVLWTVDPALQVRLSASNLTAADQVNASTVGNETSTTTARSYVSWQLRAEMKL
jgi:outer membrane receptor for ferrienterochelin and colicins